MKTSQWSKDVRKALVDRDMSIRQLGDAIGYSPSVVSQVLSGRYANASCPKITEKINKELGIDGAPERTVTPSDEWCLAVKVALLKKKMTVTRLAKETGFSRDRVSLVINGRADYGEIVSAVNSVLEIAIPASPPGDG